MILFYFSAGYMISIERGGEGISDPLYVKHSNTIDQLLLNGLETPLLSYCGRLIRVFIISNKALYFLFLNQLRIKRNVWVVMFVNLYYWLLDCDRQNRNKYQWNNHRALLIYWSVCHLTNVDLSTFNYDIHFTTPEIKLEQFSSVKFNYCYSFAVFSFVSFLHISHE